MPIQESDRDRSTSRIILLIVGFAVIFGLFFGLPPALGAHAMGWTWVPYGLGLILCGLVIGLSLACLVVAFLFDMPILRVSLLTPRPRALSSSCTAVSRKSGSCPFSAIGQRLADENVALAKLDAERARRHDSHLGTVTEQRIVWGELLELELQDIDEQVSRIRRTPGD
jgi:hypothetical protein